MKRLLSLLILALVLCSAVWAVSAEELFEEVLANSTQAEEIQKSRRTEFIEQVISAMTGPSWSISLQSLELAAKDDFRSPIAITLPTVEVGVTTPENKDKVSYEARLSIGGPQFNWDKDTDRYELDGFSYSLRTGLSKNYEFKSWDTTNYQEGQADLLRNNSYRTSILQLENSFLEDLVKILKWSKSVRDVYAEALLLDSIYKSDIKSGKLVEGSPDATVRYAEIEMKNKEAEQMLNSSETEFADFKKNYGIEPTIVTTSKEYELEIAPKDRGNTEVMSKYYEYLSALQQIDEKTGQSSQFSIKASLEPKVTMDKEFVYKTTTLSGELGATYTTGNLSMDMSLNAGYDFRADYGSRVSGPTLSVSLSWSNTPQVLSKAENERLKLLYTRYAYDAKGNLVGNMNWDGYETTLRNITNETLRKEALELEKLEYSAAAAELEWYNALVQYYSKCNELIEKVKEFKNSKELFMIKYEADKKAFGQVSELFDNGKSTVAEVLKYTSLVEADEAELLIYKIRSHILANEIEMLQM